MFSRKHQTHGVLLPKEWIEDTKLALDTRFEAFSQAYEFFVYGEVHEDELLLIISALSRNIEKSPISFFLSMDIDEKKAKKSEKLLITMLNTSELFFEEVFDTDNWNDYTATWLETASENETMQYKVTRENIYLTIEANKILSEN